MSGSDSPIQNMDTHQKALDLWAAHDVSAWCELFHPQRSRYIDPVFGEFEGRAAIQRWLVEAMQRAGNWHSRNVGLPLFGGNVAAGEAELVIPLRRGEFVLPFAWIQHYDNGSIVYRRDYYDTHLLRQNIPARALGLPETQQ